MVKTRRTSLSNKQEEGIQALKCAKVKVEKTQEKKKTAPRIKSIKQEKIKKPRAPRAKANSSKVPLITPERIKNLIQYIVDDKMMISDAAEKACMRIQPAREYFKMYMNDPEHKIPLPRKRQSNSGGFRVTEEQVKTLIDCLVNHGMNLSEAASKANMKYHTALRYYQKYKNDPNQNIPVPSHDAIAPSKAQLYDKVKTFISFIVNDNMTVYAASIKTGMCPKTGKKYYAKYLEDPERKIPVPQVSDNKVNAKSKGPTYEQVEALIGHIVNDNMSVMAAAKMVDMCTETGRRYYQKYLADPYHNIPDPRVKRSDKVTQEQIEELIHAIENNNMSISAAAANVRMGINTASMYYRMYLENDRTIPKRLDGNTYGIRPTEENYQQFHKHIIQDKMSLKRAASKAQIPIYWANKYYENNIINKKEQL